MQSENNVYMFFLGDAGRNIFFQMKKEEQYLPVEKMRHFDSYISFAFEEYGCTENAVQIGKETLGGTDTVFPWKGELAVKESRDDIKKQLRGCSTLLLVGGLGGGFGSGASPEIAKIARRMGIRVVAIFWTPFHFEGKRRAARASFYKKRLEQLCDTCFFCDHSMIREHCTAANCFDLADAVVVNKIKEFLVALQG